VEVEEEKVEEAVDGGEGAVGVGTEV